MPAAANLTDAISVLTQNTLGAFQTDDIASTITAFIALLRSIGFNEQNAAERTVTNWYVPMLAVAQAIENGVGDAAVISVTLATDVVSRMLYAALAARQFSPFRITPAQETAILAAYNATWGTF
jgi:hypothetical protein